MLTLSQMINRKTTTTLRQTVYVLLAIACNAAEYLLPGVTAICSCLFAMLWRLCRPLDNAAHDIALGMTVD